MATPLFQDGTIRWVGSFWRLSPSLFSLLCAVGRINPKVVEEAELSEGINGNRKVIGAAVACIPLIAVLVSQYALGNSLEGFGMAFLRTLFIR